MNKEEATELVKKIIAQSAGLTEANIAVVIPRIDDPSSHGYQLQIKTELVKEEMSKLKAITQANNLAVEQRKDKVIIFRPCLADYRNTDLDQI